MATRNAQLEARIHVALQATPFGHKIRELHVFGHDLLDLRASPACERSYYGKAMPAHVAPKLTVAWSTDRPMADGEVAAVQGLLDRYLEPAGR